MRCTLLFRVLPLTPSAYSVRQSTGQGIPLDDLHEGDLEHQIFTRQRMIRIQGNM